MFPLFIRIGIQLGIWIDVWEESEVKKREMKGNTTTVGLGLFLLTGLAGNQSGVTRAFLLGSSNFSMYPVLKRNTIHLVLFFLITHLLLLC